MRIVSGGEARSTRHAMPGPSSQADLPERRRPDCVFDVAVTGERGFVKVYAMSEALRGGKDEIRVDDPLPDKRR